MYVFVATPERSFRRSPDREAVFDALRELGCASLGELVDATGVAPRRVYGILCGDPPAYSAERSLVSLGLVRRVASPWGESFELTSLGQRLGVISVARAG